MITPALNAIKTFIYNLAPHPYWDLVHRHLLALYTCAILLHVSCHLITQPLTHISQLAISFQHNSIHKHDYILKLLCCLRPPPRLVFRQLQTVIKQLSQLQQISVISSVGLHHSPYPMNWLFLILNVISVLRNIHMLILQNALKLASIYYQQIQTLRYAKCHIQSLAMPLVIDQLDLFKFKWCQLHILSVLSLDPSITTCFALSCSFLILNFVTLMRKHTFQSSSMTTNLPSTYRSELPPITHLTPSGGGRSHVFRKYWTLIWWPVFFP